MKEEEILRNLLSRILNYRFIASNNDLSNVLQILKNISLELQKEDIDYQSSNLVFFLEQMLLQYLRNFEICSKPLEDCNKKIVY